MNSGSQWLEELAKRDQKAGGKVEEKPLGFGVCPVICHQKIA